VLRDYQEKLKTDVYASWNAGNRNVLAVSPTGSGKTVTMQAITDDFVGMTWSIAHRRELVGQISMAAALAGVYHRIIAPDKIVRIIIAMHVKKYGRSFVHPESNHIVASVQTINARIEQLRPIIEQAKLWNMDEAHHILETNLWGTCVAEFKNAYGAGYTALALRGDKKPLRRGSGGVFDDLAMGPEVGELIKRGFLVPYVIYGPQVSSIDVSNVPITASGDYSPTKLSTEARKSSITGDIIRDYLRFTPGKIGATFCVDVGMAEETTQAFQQAGVPAFLITDQTPADARSDLMSDLACGIKKQAVNVGIIGEGVDVPVLEVVSLGCPSDSLQKYRQEVGRVFRPAPQINKTVGVIIDHVKNVERHGAPDKIVVQSLDGHTKKPRNAMKDPDEVPIRTCPSCWRVSEAWTATCQHCGFTPAPVLRGRPELVEGDLTLYTPELLAQLGAAAIDIMKPPALPFGAGMRAVEGRRAAALRDQEAQLSLRDAIAWWAGVQRDLYDRSDNEAYIRFMRKFGIDVYSAQSLGAVEATKLNDLIWEDIGDDVDRKHVA